MEMDAARSEPIKEKPQSFSVKIRNAVRGKSAPAIDKAERDRIKVEIVAKKAELKELKQHAEVLKHRIHGKHDQGDKTVLQVAGRQFKFTKKKELPISERMNAAMLLKDLKNSIQAKKNEIKDLEKPLEGTASKVVKGGFGIVPRVFGFLTKHGVEGRIVNPSSGITTLGDPLTYYIILMDHVWSSIWVKRTGQNILQVKTLNAMIGKAEVRLDELKTQIDHGRGSPDQLEALEEEHRNLERAVKVFKEEVDRLPVAESLQQVLGESVKILWSYARIVQGLCYVLPLFINTSLAVGSALSNTITIAAVATIPISVFLSVRGISQSIKNLANCHKDRQFTSGLKNNEIGAMRAKASGFEDILSMAELTDPASRARNDTAINYLEQANRQVAAAQERMTKIDDDLLNARIEGKETIAAVKEERKKLQADIDSIHKGMVDNIGRLAEQPGADRATLGLISDKLVAKRILLTNATSLEQTMVPYLQQKLRTKVAMNLIHLTAEGISVVGSTLVVSGLILTPVHGIGIPLVTAGAGLAFVRLGVQFGAAFLVKRIMLMQMGKDRIPTKEFDVEFRERIIDEAKNWDALERAGATENTTASLMFNMLKKHYVSIPSTWGPKEWAQALANSPPGSKEWEHYDEALTAMRNRSEARFLGESVSNWVANKMKANLGVKKTTKVGYVESVVSRSEDNKYELTPHPNDTSGASKVIFNTSKKIDAKTSHDLLKAISDSGKNVEDLMADKKKIIVEVKTGGEVQKFEIRKAKPKTGIANVVMKDFIRSTKISGALEVEVKVASPNAKSDLVLNIAPPEVIEQSHVGPRSRGELFDTILEDGLFKDPYTELSSKAMQQLEGNFSQKDLSAKQLAALPEYCLVKVGDNLAIAKVKEIPANAAPNREVVEAYRQQLVSTYGESKVRYIEHLYDINLTDMATNGSPLLTEVVYRMNIGVGNLEIQDINELATGIAALTRQGPDQRPSNVPLKTLALEESGLPLQAWRGIMNHFQEQGNANPTLGDLRQWAAATGFANRGTSELSPQAFAEATKILSFSPAEREEQYTGRKILHYIHSAYSVAGVTVYKPWVDQQELLQAFGDIDSYYKNYDLKKNPNLPDPMEYYTEVLAQVICKKHLVRSHPTENYRVGALIPAPPDLKTGQPRWYVVAGAYNNGHGNFNYVLEPACNDPSLPAIKLCRSTASDPYALDGGASIRSDINPLNAPGYLGRDLLDSYEEQFFKDRTIPLWSAYSENAANLLHQINPANPDVNNVKQVFAELNHANHYLEQSMVPPRRTLMDVVSHNDYALMELAKEAYRFRSPVDADNLKLLFKYDSTKAKDISLDQQVSDARKMKVAVEKLLESNISPQKKQMCTSILADLERVINPPVADQPALIAQLKEIEGAALRALSDTPPRTAEALASITQWQNIIETHARDTGENSASKKKQDVLYVGHSLGGALAQRYMAEQTLLKDRLPVAGSHTTLYAFDAPGINEVDNRSYMSKGRENAELIKQMNVEPKVIQRYEGGDFIPGAGGGEHLGTVSSERELREAGQWLLFDASVSTPLEEVSNPIIGKSESAHATQFASGMKEGRRVGGVSVPADFKRVWMDGLQQHDLDHQKVRKYRKLDRTFSLGMVTTKVIGGVLLGMGKRIVTHPTLFGRVKSFRGPEELEHGLHREWWRLTDERGAFAVNLEGIQSAPQNEDHPLAA